MKITLETVRQILRDALGFESFTAGFISSVSEERIARNAFSTSVEEDGPRMAGTPILAR